MNNATNGTETGRENPRHAPCSDNKKLYKILFVCLGNICRSPAAEGVMKAIVDRAGRSQDYLIDSAGTGRWHIGQLPDPRMRKHGKRRGYDFCHRCRQVSESDFYDFDLIIGMDDNNIADLRRLSPTVEGMDKIRRMADFIPDENCHCVPDPYYEGAEGFELVLDLLEEGCQRLFDGLEKEKEVER